MIDFLLRRKRVLGVALILAVAGFLALHVFQAGDLSHARRLLELVLERMRRLPFPAFLALAALLPFAGVPMSALYLAAGATYAPVHGLPLTLAGISLSLALNLLVSYAFASRFREPVHRLLGRLRLPVPALGAMPAWKIVLLVRITPGAPLLAQNLLLGWMRVPLPVFLAVSLPAETLIALGYLTAGRSFATGSWGALLAGIGLVGAALLAASLLRDRARLSTQQAATEEQDF